MTRYCSAQTDYFSAQTGNHSAHPGCISSLRYTRVLHWDSSNDILNSLVVFRESLTVIWACLIVLYEFFIVLENPCYCFQNSSLHTANLFLWVGNSFEVLKTTAEEPWSTERTFLCRDNHSYNENASLRPKTCVPKEKESWGQALWSA